ncbi:MAG: hemerythrin domain-containing protein [Gammaproteobacteria bacterium]|nr:hemerythrin domain-containing protein [Gammaproteobacteria bacterium]
MISISDVMTADHKLCDDFYASAELYVSKNDWDQANSAAKEFINCMLFHFQHEEEVLFPEFEEVSGMRHGPTEMMRHEHEQMRSLMTELEKALESKNQDRYLGLSETLLIYMQQHNMKEEQILYPMIDRDCAENSEQLTNAIRDKSSCTA